MHRLFVYPLITVVALGGFLGGRWLELSGWLHITIERGGEAVGVPERVFREPPGRPPPEVSTRDTDQAPQPAATDTASPTPTPTDAATTSPSPTATATMSPTPTATQTASPSPTVTTSPIPTETAEAQATQTTSTTSAQTGTPTTDPTP